MTVNDGTIFQVALNGNVKNSYQSDLAPEGITWDGKSFWVFTADLGQIDHLRVTNDHIQTLRVIDTHSFDGTNNLAWDNGYLWWANQYNVKRLSTTGSLVSHFTKGREVAGLAWDGSHLWLAYDNVFTGSRIEVDNVTGAAGCGFTVPVSELTALAWAKGTLWALGSNYLGGTPRIYRLNLPAWA